MKGRFAWTHPSSRQAVICMTLLRVSHGMKLDDAINLSLSRNSKNPEKIPKRELARLRKDIETSMREYWPASG